MSFSSFSQFADALCKEAGAETPPLNPDSAGMVTFHMIVGDVTVNITHGTCGDGPDSEAFILVTFGLIPADQELEVLTLLAEANFSMLGADMPVLGLNPATAEVVLRQRVVLKETDATSAFELIIRLARLAQQWRVDPTLTPSFPAEPGTADAADGGPGSRLFA
jgi:hypothetical protein